MVTVQHNSQGAYLQLLDRNCTCRDFKLLHPLAAAYQRIAPFTKHFQSVLYTGIHDRKATVTVITGTILPELKI